ncbi:hypothetical protein TTHERM_000104989 (macronuclear) [Tetrahymena thermophila SB210]|uniref:Uncharacterized protein n=1 Tax=Tetrahymena thermophila (strain SB210) TaxID=312017 RepID=W7XD46_TETTS|nr:hypothetical protein TTHERM_000104989 [Tetrahymena thermophila SB210]EWS75412.1 hypothetical protein TTHERM_000104989 [Tetrahymena thermophila SB210]|eukprot:XP_012652086.1 hypothetical protein TTHERM_000104989 [Tetrahymena thermophila SB210]
MLPSTIKKIFCPEQKKHIPIFLFLLAAAQATKKIFKAKVHKKAKRLLYFKAALSQFLTANKLVEMYINPEMKENKQGKNNLLISEQSLGISAACTIINTAPTIQKTPMKRSTKMKILRRDTNYLLSLQILRLSPLLLFNSSFIQYFCQFVMQFNQIGFQKLYKQQRSLVPQLDIILSIYLLNQLSSNYY